MKAEFTDSEKEILNGKIRALARKYGVSHTYINQIVSGQIELNSKLSLKIYDGIKDTIEFFTPKTTN